MKNINKTAIGIVGVAVFAAALNGLSYIALNAKSDDVPFEIADISYTPKMSTSDAQSILSIISTEGFDSAFKHYSTYNDITDNHFHMLRKNYIEAADELYYYLSGIAGVEGEPPYYLRR